MKKSNVRFFHGEPVFSSERPMLFPNGQNCINMHSAIINYPHSIFHLPGATGATGATTVVSYARTLVSRTTQVLEALFFDLFTTENVKKREHVWSILVI
jgi:hypothetical protein